MSEGAIRLNSSRNPAHFPRGKSHRETEAKTTVGVYLPKTLVEKAKKHKLNLSKILEEALSSILGYMEAQNLETSQTESSKFLGEASFQKEGSWAGSSAGMNARLALVFNGSFNGKSLDWEAFGEWLQKNFSEGYSRDLLNYSKRFSHVLFSGEASELLRLSNGVRKMALASLSNLAKFLGIYEDFKRLVKNYGLKWSGGKAEDYLISRIAHTENNGEVLEWVRLVKAEIPQLNVFMDFMVLSGLRLKEAVNSFNLIIDLAREGRLSEYYNEENEALEHYRFKGLFMRKSKKVFVSFIPKKLVQEISKQEKVTFYQINNWVRRDKRLKARFSDIREYFASVMTRWLNPAEIDFLQGRISGSVFMRNYFNPALIGDLKERVFKGIAEIQSKLCNS